MPHDEYATMSSIYMYGMLPERHQNRPISTTSVSVFEEYRRRHCSYGKRSEKRMYVLGDDMGGVDFGWM